MKHFGGIIWDINHSYHGLSCISIRLISKLYKTSYSIVQNSLNLSKVIQCGAYVHKQRSNKHRSVVNMMR